MTDPRSNLTTVIADLEFVAAYWDDLATARLPLDAGLPWHGITILSAAAIEERDTQAWQDRLDRTVLAIGESPAPLDLAVVDTMVAITRDAAWLAGHLATPWGEQPRRVTLNGVPDPRGALLYTAQRLVWLTHLCDDETAAEWIDWIAPVARRLAGNTLRTLSLRLDGQILPIHCPWCVYHPDAPSWRIRILPSSPPQVAIVCQGDCEPPLREVDTWWAGRPCWLLPNWERLAVRVLTPAERLKRVS